jgi:putative hemolysin
MLREFMQRGQHMAFIADEHGTLLGIVTLDDLLAELVGELLDDDDDDEVEEIERSGTGECVVKASMDIEDFTTETNIALPEGDYHTVGGFVFHRLGRLARRGDVVEVERARLTVAEVDGRRILAIRVTPLGGDDAQAAG